MHWSEKKGWEELAGVRVKPELLAYQANLLVHFNTALYRWQCLGMTESHSFL